MNVPDLESRWRDEGDYDLWLVKKDGGELQKKYVWFSEGMFADEKWLVKKEEKRNMLVMIPRLEAC